MSTFLSVLKFFVLAAVIAGNAAYKAHRDAPLVETLVALETTFSEDRLNTLLPSFEPPEPASLLVPRNLLQTEKVTPPSLLHETSLEGIFVRLAAPEGHH